MIAKINRSESLYGALIYNQNKVAEGSARIISGNRMICDVANIPDNVMRNIISSFEDYLGANKRTKKPILHISLNPALTDKLLDEQLADLAKEYMEKMRYGDQPYVVYLHEDTGRRHVHIVSTCVDENGAKIDDSYEWKRSMQACRELEQKYGLQNATDVQKESVVPFLRKVNYEQGDVKHQIANTLKGVVDSYKFQTFGEFAAVLSCYDIEAKMVRGEHNGKPYTGIIYSATDNRGKVLGTPFKSSLFGKRYGHDGLSKKMARHTLGYKNRKWGPKIHDTVRLAMLTCGGKQRNFEKIMRNKGLEVVLRKNDDGRIYGVTFVDHSSREVYNGSRLGKEFSANAFETLFNSPAQQTAPQMHSDHQPSHESDRADLLDQIFGLFPAESDNSAPDDELLRRPKRKKKKRRCKGFRKV